MVKTKAPKRHVEFRGEAGKQSDSIKFRGCIYFWAGNFFRKVNAVKYAKEMRTEGYRARLVKGVGIWRIYTSPKVPASKISH